MKNKNNFYTSLGKKTNNQLSSYYYNQTPTSNKNTQNAYQ